MTAFNDVTLGRNGKNAVSQSYHNVQHSAVLQAEDLTSPIGRGIMGNEPKLIQTERYALGRQPDSPTRQHARAGGITLDSVRPPPRKKSRRVY